MIIVMISIFLDVHHCCVSPAGAALVYDLWQMCLLLIPVTGLSHHNSTEVYV